MSGLAFALLTSCLSFDVKENSSDTLVLYPDYKDVTIPYNIAPLNFMPEGVDKGLVRFENEKGDALIASVRKGRTSVPLKTLLSSSPKPGAVCTIPVPSSVETKSALKIRNAPFSAKFAK